MNQFAEIYEDAASASTQTISNIKLYKNESGQSVLKRYFPQNLHGQVIGKIVHNYFYVYEDTRVSDLVDELIMQEDINAVGVINSAEEIIGLVNRQELFDKMSKTFGRDLYKNKELSSFITQTEIFNYKKNIFSVANMMSDFLNNQKDIFFILEDDAGNFAGIFSSKDLLIYLSEITQKDIALAKKMQACVVKEEKIITGKNCEIIGATRMAKGVGGDFYYIDQYQPGKWFFSICDVSGKGVSAALLSGIISGMTSIYDFKNGIEDFIIKLNSYILNSFQSDKFVTGIFIDYNEADGEVIFYNIGHSYSFLYRNQRLFRILSEKDTIPLGILPEINPEKASFKLNQDDLLILMTDGIEDQLSADGEQYGIQRIFSILKQNNIADIKQVKNNLFADLKKFRTSQTQNDDITLVMVKQK